jgi:formylglycine-generating enzyme required for sulfatase activity
LTIGLTVLAVLGGSYVLNYYDLVDLHTPWAWLTSKFGVVLQPEMVTLKGGTFRMGCLEAKGCEDRELPVREVSVKRFAIGRYEVTYEDYDQFAMATKRELPDDKGWGRGRRPVINVSWADAKAYAEWLSERTGKRYRLPAEAEWEYAARAGTQTPWSFGDDASTLGDYAWFRGNSGDQSHPVGNKQPNPWGLYDVHGNVWEWVEDCWHGSYQDAPTDGRPWLTEGGGDCGRRVIRGGSWDNVPVALRSAYRGRDYAVYRGIIGFRLAQDL